MNQDILLSKNAVVRHLNKPAKSFTREDIVKFVIEKDIEMINFMYPAADGRLKTLNFVINNLDYLHTILAHGERVDGSSLFPAYVEAGNSDLYVVPRYSTAFVDMFAPCPTLSMLCTFLDKNGNPFEASPAYILHKACEAFTDVTGYRFQAMGELEYYVIKSVDENFAATDQRGYHESAPFAKFNDLRVKCMSAIAATGGCIKYGHSEVGNFSKDGMIYEQNEIEFLPVDAEDAADQLVLAKWIIRNMAYKEGCDVTFAPKITTGKAGSGLHIHMRILDKDGHNIMLDSNKNLSVEARRAIAGIMKLAPSLTAFGNVIPTSYFRLVPHQEAPTNVCWGDRNRSVLVRVPLGWTTDKNMAAIANPQQTAPLNIDTNLKQTVELRSADGSADVYLLIAGLAVACRYGFEMAEALEVAEDTYVDVNIHSTENKDRLTSLQHLPANCSESSDALLSARNIYEAYGVFTPHMIDGVVGTLQSFSPEEINVSSASPEEMARLVKKYFYCG